jgi:hypothetical protein
MTRRATDEECFALQAYAITQGIPGMDLRRLAYAALGHDSRVAMMPLQPEEIAAARRKVTDELELLRMMGVAIEDYLSRFGDSK